MCTDLEDDTGPTERFARQICPHCAADTAVALSFAMTSCDACGEPVEVAPMRSRFPRPTPT